MRIAFAGTPAFAVPSLQGLISSRHEVVCVITQPDRPAGRGLSLRPSPVKALAEKHGLKVYQPLKFNSREFLDGLEALDLDLIVTAAYGRIFRARSLGIPSRGCVNLHASLLPAYRGVAPINWAVIKGETETGVTTFFMEEGVDTGEMIVQKRTSIGENETAGDVYERLALVGAEALLETCDLIARDEAPRMVQDDSLASYAPKLSKQDAEIGWNGPARDVHNHIRGVNPRPGAFANFRGSTVKILASRLGQDAAAGSATGSRGDSATGSGAGSSSGSGAGSGVGSADVPGAGGGAGGAAAPGTVIDIRDGDGILIACSGGSVWLREVQAAGRKPAGGAAFSRGARLKRGERFA
jgi:methionyl-tRNA formyltransferase